MTEISIDFVINESAYDLNNVKQYVSTELTTAIGALPNANGSVAAEDFELVYCSVSKRNDGTVIVKADVVVE